MPNRFSFCVLAATIGLAACGTRDSAVPAGAPAIPAAAQAEANSLFTTFCATCHGATGKGDGAGAAAMNPKPRDYSDKAWQSSVKDEDIAEVIVEGGPAVGKSVLMPGNPGLKEKPDVVKALVAKIRSFGK